MLPFSASFSTPSLSSSSSPTCVPHHSLPTLLLGLFLCLGLVISYLPQLYRIIHLRSSLGFSPWFLLLGATSSASTFLNVVALQWNSVTCCKVLSKGECAEGLVGVMQVGLQWGMFAAIFILFLIYYPKELRYERVVALIDDGRNEGADAREDNEEDTDDDASGNDDDGSSIGDIDSLGSHIAANYSTFDGGETPPRAGGDAGAAAAVAGSSRRAEGEAEGADAPPPSSSAFWRLVPSFWPLWNAPTTAPAANAQPQRRSSDSRQALLSTAPSGLRRKHAKRTTTSGNGTTRPRSRRRTHKVKTPEWRLAINLAWIVAIHFLFVTVVTLLLVSSLPSNAFPSPDKPPMTPAPIPLPPSRPSPPAGTTMTAVPFGSSSRLLISRWAAFLGLTGTLLAAAQYVPQLIHTFKQRTVGSLSIPMMCLQVPGSGLFVYSLAVRPGIEWTSLAAYVTTGVLQGGLLVMCLVWRRRQRRRGVDDYGRPLAEQGDEE